MKTSPPPIYDPASFSREESIGYLISAVKARLVVALATVAAGIVLVNR